MAFDLDCFRAGDQSRRDVCQMVRDLGMTPDADPMGIGQAISILMNLYAE